MIQTLDAQGQAELFEEQKRWLVKRAENAQAAVISKGGSLTPLEYSGAFKKITEERLAELQKRLQQPPNINHSKSLVSGYRSNNNNWLQRSSSAVESGVIVSA